MFCIHLCRSNLFSALAAGPLWKFSPGLFLREFVQPNAAQVETLMTLEDDYCGVFFKLKFLILTLRHIFYSPNSSNIHGECDFTSSISGNKLRKYTFLWFLKKAYIANGWKIKVNSTKNMLSSCLVDIFFRRAFLL